MIFPRLPIIFSALIVAAIVSPAQCGTIVFSDRSSWEAAASGIQLDDLNSYSDTSNPPNSPLFLNDTVLIALDVGRDVNLRSDALLPVDGSRYAHTRGTLRVAFPTTISAFAFDNVGIVVSGSVDILDDTGLNIIDSFTFNTGQPTDFVGFILDAGEQGRLIDIHPSVGENDSWSLDNLAFVSVPEPSTSSLWSPCLCVGLVALRRVSTRRPRQ